MDIRYEDEYFEEPNEELGAMAMPPILGVQPSPKTSTTHAILEQLENDIQRQAQENKTKKPIEKILLAQFKEIQAKGKRIQEEQDKED
jgi:hypothetical protein